MKNQENLAKIRHTLAHLLAAAVLEIYPNTKNTIGPAIDTGFYYDFEFETPITEDDLKKIYKKMLQILPNWTGFTHKEVSPSEVREYFKNNPYKLELIDEILEKGEKITLYTSGNFTDLCRGGHSENPNKDIAKDSWKLDRIAGAYWRGDEKNKMLTRIYGLAFESEDALKDYKNQKEEAQKRDHKKLGHELDLFTFSELVGPGLPLWTPKGTLVRNLLDDFVWSLRKEYGYEKVEIPHITKKDLYEKSGHWEKFKDELFRIQTREGHEFAMKPMNCPHHTQIYARRMWSYRDLPQKYANTTTCYRDEQSGELAGLSRVRAFAQDDAHVFCRLSQIKEEVLNIWDIIHKFYGVFGFSLIVRLSTHDPKQMNKYLGSEETWQKSEKMLAEVLKEKDIEYIDGLGEAAFYGPKLDFMAKDSLGREWQIATIQLDMNMPERFDLFCINEKNEQERIVMIHAAIMGSIERFLAILIEHTAGIFPLWLSPIQIKILPISEKQNDKALEIHNELLKNDIRSEIDLENNSLGKKIRTVKQTKIPYYIVIGEKETESNKFGLENRSGDKEEGLDIDKIVEKLIGEIKTKS